MLNFDCHTCSDLRLLDDVLRLVVDLERGDFAKLDDLLLLRFWIDLDYTQWCADA